MYVVILKLYVCCTIVCVLLLYMYACNLYNCSSAEERQFLAKHRRIIYKSNQSNQINSGIVYKDVTHVLHTWTVKIVSDLYCIAFCK